MAGILIRDIVKGVTVLYGEAGCGKTNLALRLMSELCDSSEAGRCYFISTEGPQYLHLLNRYRLGDECLFATAVSSEHLLRLTFEILRAVANKEKVRLVIVDSINSFYRMEAAFEPSAGRVFGATIAMLSRLSEEGIPVLLTAQVKGDEGISGERYILFWCDILIKCVKHGRGLGELILLNPKNLEELGRRVPFEIGEDGVKLGNGLREAGDEVSVPVPPSNDSQRIASDSEQRHQEEAPARPR